MGILCAQKQQRFDCLFLKQRIMRECEALVERKILHDQDKAHAIVDAFNRAPCGDFAREWRRREEQLRNARLARVAERVEGVKRDEHGLLVGVADVVVQQANLNFLLAQRLPAKRKRMRERVAGQQILFGIR